MGKGFFRFGLARLIGGFKKASGADAKTQRLRSRWCSHFRVLKLLLIAMAISKGLFFAAPAEALYFERQQVTGFWLMDPSDVCSADIDGDGDMDIVATSITGNDVAWWENMAGDGSQWAEFIVDGSYKGAQAVAVADIDGDGDMDIAACATDSWSSSVAWWENTAGDGKSWTKRTIISPFGGTTSLLAADIDGDGDTDVAATAYNDDDLAWFENQGGGLSWQTHTLDADLNAANSVEAGDLDGDGDTDILATASVEKRIVWWENQGASWSEHTFYQFGTGYANCVQMVDMDGDGDMDVAAGLFYYRGGSLAWFENTADGWTRRDVDQYRTNIPSIYVTDIDGDGDMDIAGTDDRKHEVALWENTGTDWSEYVIATDYSSPRSVHVEDVDGDGRKDILAVAYGPDDLSWWKNPGSLGGEWSKNLVTENFGDTRYVLEADMDKDGDPDLVSVGYQCDDIGWFENDGGGSYWEEHTIDGDFYKPDRLAVADFDKDGDLDVASVTSPGHQAAWWENPYGEGSEWTKHTLLDDLYANPIGVHDADIDGDSWTDIVVWTSQKDVFWYRNPGEGGGEWTATMIVEGEFITWVDTADIDRDGATDVVGAANSNNELIWWRNVNGDGQTWERKSVDAFQSAKRVCVTDLDQDGDMDILATADNINQGVGDIAWWENVDDGDDPGHGESWLKHMVDDDFEYANFAQAVDMDLDGDLDILAHSYFVVAWWENGGDPAASWQKHEAGGYFEYADKVRATDMDGDLDIDIIAAVDREGILWLENKPAPLTVEMPAFTVETFILVGGGSVSVSEAPGADVTVRLSSDDESEVTVPPSVTIWADQTSADFDIYAVGDGILDGAQTATVTASAEGYYSPGSDSIVIYDVRTVNLTVEIPENATEGDGILATQGTVSVGETVDEDVVVALACDDETELRVPDTATILSGQSSAQFELVVVDDEEFDGAQTVQVTASFSTLSYGTDTMEVADDETYDLLLAGPETVVENDGTLTAAMDVSIPGILDVPLVIDLYSDAPSVATVPETVTILAGQFHRKFDLTLIDDSVYGGPTTVNIEASATGWTPDDLDIDVTDNETYPVVEFQAAASEGDESVADIEFAVTLTPGCLRTATVNYAVTESTATGGGVDYTLADGQLTFDPGETSATIYATVVDDEDDDDDEYFTVTLSGPTEANLGTNSVHTYTIIDNDRIPVTLTVCSSGCQHTSIQAAIDEALEEDTVLVSPGTYAETIDFGGKPITVKSVEGPNQTVIDGGCAGSVVRFVTDETAASILEGFTIENGCADYGGGIFLDGASPQIKQCHVVKNKAAVGGGGIFASNGSSPAVSDCVVAENRADGYGGGLACESSSAPEFSDGLIAGNYTEGDGGGAYADDASPVLTRTEIEENSAMQNGGGLLFANGAAPLVSRSRVRDNSAYVSGGGAHVSDGAAPEFVNVMAVGNSATYDGGAFYASGAATQLSVVNSTVSENSASFGGGVFAEDATVLIGNSIFWNDGREIDLFGAASAVVQYSDVQTASGAYPGTGNINDAPLFVSPGNDWRLQSGSPCIDAADTSSASAEDFDGQARPFGTEADMGADEWNDSLPTPEFSASPVEGYATLSVAFTDLSGPEAQIASRLWDFGDGSSSTDANPTHEYAGKGRYTVTLTVENASGSQFVATKAGYVEVKDDEPTAAFSFDPTGGHASLSVSFSDDSYSPSGVASRIWEFGDGATSTDENPVHVYETAGTYRPRLTVTDADGDSDSFLLPDPICVADPGPKASFNAFPITGNAPLNVAFYDASTSYAPITSWRWDFGDSSPLSSERNPFHKYAAAGEYDVTLTVTSENGQDSEIRVGYVRVRSDAQTLSVCSDGSCDHLTIQGAIDAASDGDTVLVKSGTFYENIVFGGKAVRVVSESGSGSTIIDGGGAGSVASFVDGEDAGSVLEGFTLRNGSAAFGGGVYCDSFSSPQIRSCNISNNEASEGGGGAAAMNSSHPLFYSCLIQFNQADFGGGLACLRSSSPAFQYTSIFLNQAAEDGGGVFAFDGSSPVFEKPSTIAANQAGDMGGGLFARLCSIHAKDVSMIGNGAKNGAAAAFVQVCSAVMERCKMTENEATGNGGAVFGIDSSLSKLRNCLVAENTAAFGAAASFDNVALPSAINCTIADNAANEDGPGIVGTKVKGGLRVINTILRNGGDEIVLADSDPEVVEYSNVEQDSGTYPGTGNTNLAPLFVDAPDDYSLASGSPCRNTGTSNGVPADDLDGKQRPQGAGYDMGCYEADNLAPVIEQSDPLTATMDEDGAPTAWESPALSATDGDADVLEWSVSSPASNGTATVSGSGASPTTFEYQPDDNYNGPDSFEIQVSDNQGGTDTITVNVTVDPVNDPPTIEGEPETSVDAYSPYEFVPSADDPDLEGGDTLSFEIANKPSWADFSTETGALTGTPDNSDCGTYENIQISVRDLEGETATLDAFDLTVNMAPGQPSAKTGPAESPESTKATLTGEVNPNGGDTQYYFEYWIDSSDKKTTDTATEPASVGDVSVFATAYGLDPATEYTFRLVARNDADEAFGEEMTFDSAPMTSETVYVDPQARCGDHVPCFAEISKAMDNALQGSTILVGASTYCENLTIEPGMTVQLGQNCDFSGTVPVEPVIIVGESQ